MDFSPSTLKDKILNIKQSIVDSYKESIRVLKITEKPDREEFVMSAKITAAGTAIVGLIGFLFYLASNLIPQML